MIPSVLAALTPEPQRLDTVAARAGCDLVTAVSALRDLRGRRLAQMPHIGFFCLPAGLTTSQAVVLYWVGERGATSAAELATTVSGPVDADLRALESDGRIQRRGGQWQIRQPSYAEVG